jgi:MFS family permease
MKRFLLVVLAGIVCGAIVAIAVSLVPENLPGIVARHRAIAIVIAAAIGAGGSHWAKVGFWLGLALVLLSISRLVAGTTEDWLSFLNNYVSSFLMYAGLILLCASYAGIKLARTG